MTTSTEARDILSDRTRTYYDMGGKIPGATVSVTIDTAGPDDVTIITAQRGNHLGFLTREYIDPNHDDVITARRHEDRAHGTGILFLAKDDCYVLETVGGRLVKYSDRLTKDQAVTVAQSWAGTYGATYAGFLQI